MSGTAPEPPSVQSPFARFRCYRRRGNVAHPLGERYPSVFAPTGSCASPRLSDRLRSSLGRPVFAGCRQPRLRRGPSRRSSVNLSSDAWTPAPVVVTMLVLVTSRDASAFPALGRVGCPQFPAQRLLCGSNFRDCSHSLRFRPPSLLAPQIAPTAGTVPWAAGALTLGPTACRYQHEVRAC